jgi:hypothetical protein
MNSDALMDGYRRWFASMPSMSAAAAGYVIRDGTQ